MNAVAANRRQILQGTAVLALGMTASGRVVLAAEEAAAPPAPIGPRMFDVWLQFKPDNTLTFISPELESGQGVITGLAILVADELDADWSKVAVVQSGTDRIYANPMSHSVSTNASASIRMRFDQMRKIGATAREMLKAAAAAQWSVPVAELTTDKSTVAHAASKRSATYTSLAAAAAKLPVPENVALRPKSQWKLIGKSIPRIDIEDKCTGRAQYGVDFRMPGMLHAAVARGPVFGAKVKSFDDAAAKARKGVKAVENMGYGVAVVADDAWTARRALEDVKIVWDEVPGAVTDSAAIAKQYSDRLAGAPGLIAKKTGDYDQAARAPGVKLVEAEYTLPFLHHQCMEPPSSTAWWHDGMLEVWAPTSGAGNLVAGAAYLTGLPPEKIRVNRFQYVGGSFGRRSHMEQDIDAIRLSQKFNAPVQVVLRREHDVQYGPFRPYQKTTIAAAVDSKGNIAGWKQKIASQSIIAETYEDLAQAGGVDMTKVKADVKQRGGFYVMPFDYFAVDETPFNSPYDVGAVHLEYAQMDLPVPPTHWRSVGISGNIFEMEGFMDEVAHAAKVDPIAFRKNLLKANPRNVAVLDELTKMIGWKYPQREKNGWGISFAEGFTARAAAAIQVAVQGKKIVIKRLVAVVDVGQVVTHDQVLAQLQGGIIDGLATASFQEITFKSGKVVQSNWGDYRTYTLAQQPQMELKILDNDAAPGSISELSTPLIIPALTNAVFAATGTRVRELPLTKAGFSV